MKDVNIHSTVLQSCRTSVWLTSLGLKRSTACLDRCFGFLSWLLAGQVHCSNTNQSIFLSLSINSLSLSRSIYSLSLSIYLCLSLPSSLSFYLTIFLFLFSLSRFFRLYIPFLCTSIFFSFLPAIPQPPFPLPFPTRPFLSSPSPCLPTSPLPPPRGQPQSCS